MAGSGAAGARQWRPMNATIPPAPPDDDVAAMMRTNRRRYPWFVAATSASPWLPVFFLLFESRVGFEGALALAATYYLAVVVLEVPSGYFSDRFGRRPTLMLASLALLAAYAGFALLDGFAALAVCQTLLAAGIAFQSGSDSALLHDSLAALGKTSDYAAEEARSRAVSLGVTSVSCLLGGLLGSVSLVLPYVLAALTAVVATGLAAGFVEPPVDRASASDLLGQGHAIARRLGDRVLAWLLLWYVLAFVLAHVPFELYQPWIRLLGESGDSLGTVLAGGTRAPIVSGVVLGLSMFGGMLGALISLRVAARLGLSSLLLLANVVQLAIIGGLALALHPVVLVLVFARNFAMNMTHAPVMAAIAPRVGSGERATWLSLQSLAGRLGFALVMYLLASRVDARLDWPTLSTTLALCAVAGLLAALGVWMIGRGVLERARTSDGHGFRGERSAAPPDTLRARQSLPRTDPDEDGR